MSTNVEPRAAQAELDALTAEAAASRGANQTSGIRLGLRTFTDAFVGGPAARMLLAIMAAASLVADLLRQRVAVAPLARQSPRARGGIAHVDRATRSRIVRQLLIEILVLATAGAPSV